MLGADAKLFLDFDGVDFGTTAWGSGGQQPGLRPAYSIDSNLTAFSTTEEVDFPIHVLALNAIGIHLLDYLQFEDLVECCEAERRWEFLFVGAPLRVAGGTGSPLNPIAIF